MAAPDNDKALDGILQRNLRSEADTGDCPAPDILAAYQEGSLEGEELERHELHFSRCARCREQLGAIARAGAEVEIPAYATTAAASQAPAATHAAPASDAGGRGRLLPRRRIWFLNWRVLAPVAAALALTAILYSRLTNRPATPSTPQTEVAMSKQEPPPSSVAERVTPPEAPAAQPAASGAPAAAPKAALKSVPMPRGRATFAKKAEVQPAAPSREELERRQTMAETLQREQLSNSLEVNRGAAAGAGTGAGAVAGGAGTGTRASAPLAQRMKAPSRAGATSARAFAAPVPPSPPSSGAETVPAEKPSATTSNVEVTAQAPAVQTSAAAGDAFAPAPSPANLPIKGRNAATQITVSIEQAVIKSPDTAVMYRIADGGFIERTQDSGATWQGQLVDSSAQFTAGAAPAAKICWLVGRDGAIYLSKDGVDWAKIPPPAKADFIAVTATNASSAIVTASDGRKFSTRDGGKTWTLLK